MSIAALRQRDDLHLVEARDTVGLGEGGYPVGLAEGFIGDAEQRLAVIGDGELLAVVAKAETVPFVRRYPQIGPSQLFAAAVDDAIESDVILERVGAHHTVVVGIREPHRDAAGPIDLAADRLEAEFDVEVGGGEAVVNGEGKAVIGALGAALLDRAS